MQQHNEFQTGDIHHGSVCTVTNHHGCCTLPRPASCITQSKRVCGKSTCKCLSGSSASVNIHIALVWSVREFVASVVNVRRGHIAHVRCHSNPNVTRLQLHLAICGKTVAMGLFIYLKHSGHIKLTPYTQTYNNNHFTFPFPQQPEWASTRTNILQHTIRTVLFPIHLAWATTRHDWMH